VKHVFYYSVPVEVTVRVDAVDNPDDLDDVDRAAHLADELVRETLSRLAIHDDGPVRILAPVDVPPSYEISRED
jgi:hypothetical protein